MKATYSLTVPDEVEATMTVTMSIGQWRKLAGQIDGVQWPGCDMLTVIRDLVRRADTKFTETDHTP